MLAEPCETRTNRSRTIQVARIGAIALLTVSSGIGCGQTVLRTPAGRSASASSSNPALPPPVARNDPNPGPNGGWGRRTGAEQGPEAPVTPISPSPLEVAIGPRLKVGTWNGWRLPVRGKKEAKPAESVPTVAIRERPTTIPMPKRPMISSPPTSGFDEKALAASRETHIALPSRSHTKATGDDAFEQTGIAPPKRIIADRQSKPESVAIPIPVPVAPDLAEPAPVVVDEAPAAVSSEEPNSAETPATIPLEAVGPVEATESVSSPTPEGDSSTTATGVEAAPEAVTTDDAQPEEETAKTDPAAVDTADPAPSFEEPTKATAIEPSDEPLHLPDIEATTPAPEPLSVPASPTGPSVSSESTSPDLVLPEFDDEPLNLTEVAPPSSETGVEMGNVVDADRKAAPKIDPAMAKADGSVDLMPDLRKSMKAEPIQKAAKLAGIPLPVKKQSKPATGVAANPVKNEPTGPLSLPSLQDAPREIDPDTFKGKGEAPEIP